jgi:hypothetical protein
MGKTRFELDPTRILAGIQDEPGSNSAAAAQAYAILHGWIAAGGTLPRWEHYPLGTARFLKRLPMWKKLVPDASRFTRAAKVILDNHPDNADEEGHTPGGLTMKQLDAEIERALSRGPGGDRKQR